MSVHAAPVLVAVSHRRGGQRVSMSAGVTGVTGAATAAAAALAAVHLLPPPLDAAAFAAAAVAALAALRAVAAASHTSSALFSLSPSAAGQVTAHGVLLWFVHLAANGVARWADVEPFTVACILYAADVATGVLHSAAHMFGSPPESQDADIADLDAEVRPLALATK